MNKIVIMLTCFILLGQYAHADGRQLYNQCQLALDISAGLDRNKNAHLYAGYCIGFIGGMAGLNTLLRAGSGGKGLFCIPNEKNTEDKIKTVMSYIENNPDANSEYDAGVVMLAFIEAYPCEQPF